MTTAFLKAFASFPSNQQVEAHPLTPSFGKIPAWLNGTFIRNGPGQYELAKSRMQHWFDGFALLCKFEFADGTASFSARFLESEAWTYANKHGELKYREFVSQPHSTFLTEIEMLLRPVYSDNVSINVARMDNQLMAVGDTPWTVEFDPITLDTLGKFNFDDQLGIGFLTTPHSLYDSQNHGLFNYFTSFKNFGLSSNYNIYFLPDGSRTRQLVASVPTKAPAYMHTFAMTENYVILTEYSMVMENLLGFIFTSKPALDDYTWAAEKGTRFIAVSKKDRKVVKIWQGEAAFGVHQANAFERDGDIFIDISTYDHKIVLHSLIIDKLMGPKGGLTPMGQLRRYRLPKNSSTADYEVLIPDAMEMPRINYSRNASRDYQYMYAVGRHDLKTANFYDQLLKIDVRSGSVKYWSEFDHNSTEPALQSYPGEPVFIPRPGGTADDDGIVLAFVFDGRNDCTYLLMLDGQTFDEICRLPLPYVIPFGFHGQFYPTKDEG